ncbi:hypothetical protein N2152v2_008990 [Parachlorella kessleri]
MAQQNNNFSGLAELLEPQHRVGGSAGKQQRRRRRRGKGSGGAVLDSSDDGGAVPASPRESPASPDGVGSAPSAAASPAHLCSELASSDPPLVRQASEGSLSQPAVLRQTSESCLDRSAAVLPEQMPRLRSSKSDVGSLVDMHSDAAMGAHYQRPSENGLDSIFEGQQSPRAAQLPSISLQPLSPRAVLRRRPSMSEVFFQPFSEYLSAELLPGPTYPTTDVVWGQTERDRVYNAILAVPYQLERFLWFGMLVCLDSFMAVFTLLPVRFAYAVFTAAWDCLVSRLDLGASRAPAISGAGPGAMDRQHQSHHHHQQQQQQQSPIKGRPRAPQGQSEAATTAAAACLASTRRLRGDQLYDLLGVLIFVGTVLFLWHLNAGTLYFWMKDLTQEFLKLSVLFTALELSDKICCNFGVDVLEALAASCTQYMAAPSWAGREAASLASDLVVATLLVMVHGTALMSQAMVFGVAMNSKKNALVALLIASNFTEIKGTVLKRFDSNKLYVLACQDVVERFHLLITLSFVVVEEMGSSGHSSPNRAIVVQCCQIFFSEAVIDVIKHAVLGKFNDIRPGVYREFMKDLCDRVSGAQSHNIHKAMTYLALCYDGYSGASSWQICWAALLAAAGWVALFAAKLLLGWLLKQASASYVRHFEARRARLLAKGGRRVTLAGSHVPGKKEE